MIEAVGYVGSAGAALMWMPQAARALRHRRQAARLAGISASAYLWAIAFNALLLGYGLLGHAAPVVLAGSVNLACASLIVAVVLVARRSAP
ncbi:MAG TPA: hypothetical protein VNS55_02925 [Nocardioides sp.]|nr:hypothetical protein [Nocardioides sp.]